MKKLILCAMSMLAIFALVACDPTPEEGANDKQKDSTKVVNEGTAKHQDVKLTKNVGETEMTVDHIKQKIIKKKKHLELQFSLTNHSSTDKGFGANDFRIEADDSETYRIDGTKVNFGDVIAPHKTLTGSAYFVIPEKIKSINVVYQPEEKMEAAWKIDLE
ncbi:DUF4352 domain-containing protein [Listeria riparia]|uniref:DUF4352 domain-containing protein n=1 Tax=Listeria riparia FSL S10-1204 TaxID=1265816 RepID=W7D0P3_9LIST|nr:DUF4352 domain-containing protein [Listeria riparia]EUJ42752.1 hypothetical protein PRIP_15457 [Listeria riparia FSL S10-1204]